MDCYILWVEIKKKKGARLDPAEIKQFIIFIEGIIPSRRDMLYSNATFNLHKEFHCALASLKAGLELVFIMEEACLLREKPFSLQYVISYGDIEVPRRKSMFRGIVGTGLAHADVLMQRLRDSKTDRFYVSIRDLEESEFLRKLFGFYQSICDAWRPGDYKLAAELLLFDYKFIAKSTDKAISGIWRRHKSLNIRGYQTIKDLILKTPDLIIKKKQSWSNEQPPAF
ncbi:MAG: hypothetical protein ACOYM0_09410 [Bacteroidales bacterium]